MSARTKNQQLALDVALSVFRRISLTHMDVRWLHPKTRTAITIATARTQDGKPQDETVLARIAVAYPDLPIELVGGKFHGRTWAKRLATEVIIQIIRDICGVNPVYGERSSEWMFLGRTICADRHAPGIILPGLIVNEVELADLFATEDGHVLSVCYAHTASSTVGEVHTRDGLGSGNSNLREAARRYNVLTSRLAT